MNIFGKALRNIRRTPYQSMAAIMVLTITFFVAVLLGFVTLSLKQTLLYFESRPQILVFFETTTREDDILDLKQKLDQIPEVSEVTYVPQEEALEIYQELNKNDPLLLELVTSDILPASLEISAVSIEALKALRSETETAVGVEEVVLRNDVVDTLNKWLRGLEYAGGAFISIMIITSILIVGIVVGMKISGKQFEIRVLQLMGATGWYIQAPYLLEGAFYGILSANIAFILALSLILYASPMIFSFSGEIPLFPESMYSVAIIYGAAIGTGLVVGGIGSYIAVRRYLDL